MPLSYCRLLLVSAAVAVFFATVVVDAQSPATTTTAVTTTTTRVNTTNTTTRAPNATNTTKAPTTTASPTPEMSWQAWVSVATCLVMLFALTIGVVDCCPGIVMASLFLFLVGIINLTDFLAGLSSPSVLTIALLFIVVDPIAELPLVKKGVGLALAGSGGESTVWPNFKVVLMCLLTSSFLNNAPQVAMLTNMIKNYCREHGLYPSQLLMPMNFATLCGNYAIIGTSTNLIVDGLMRKLGLGPMPFFELIKINGPFTIVMLVYLVFMPKYLLPLAGTGLVRVVRNSTKFLVQGVIQEGSALIGKRVSEIHTSIHHAHPDAAIIQITRDRAVLFPLSGDEILEAADIITIRGDGTDLSNLGPMWGVGWQTVDTQDADFTKSFAMSRSFAPIAAAGTDGGSQTASPAVSTTQHPVPGGVAAADATTTDSKSSQPTAAGTTEENGGKKPVQDGAGSAATGAANEPFPSSANNSMTAMPRVVVIAAPTPHTQRADTQRNDDLTRSFTSATLRHHHKHVDVAHEHTAFYEVVVSFRCPHLGVSIGSGMLQKRYNVSILTVRPVNDDDGALTGAPLAQHSVQAGDTILILAHNTFVEEWTESKEFLVINTCAPEEEGDPEIVIRCPSFFPLGDPVTAEDGASFKLWKTPWFYPYLLVPVFLAMVSCAIAGFELAVCALCACVFVIAIGIITAQQAFSFVELEVIVMVAFSFGLGSAMEKSGFADFLGYQVKAAHVSGIALLYILAGMTTLMTNVITNKACVQVLVPLIVAIYRVQGLNPLPPVIMCCSLASMALSTPHGFATNLMVMGPGGYKPSDFIKFGLPLNILATAIIPIITAGVYQMPWS